MDDVMVDELFARFEADASVAFPPAPVQQLQARARRRRRARRTVLAVVLATLVTAPAGALAVGGRRGDAPRPVLPVVTPSASSSPSPAVHPVERRVALTGVDLPLRFVWFVQDARHAWALFDSCMASQPEGATCQHALGSTEDGGVSWRKVNLPTLPSAAINFYPLNARTATVHVLGERFLLTTDGGLTFTAHPLAAPPIEAQLANARSQIPRGPAGNEFTILCPGATGFEDGATGVECDRRQLVKIGVGSVRPQPTVPGNPREVVRGGDGRLWMVSQSNPQTQVDSSHLAVSLDNARTWTDLGSVPGYAELSVSPDGRDVWLVAGYPSHLWRLADTTLVAGETLPDGILNYNVHAIGGGLLAVGSKWGTNSGFWRDGGPVPIPGLRVTEVVQVLSDGSVVFFEAPGKLIVGIGSGLERTWVRYS